MDKHEPNRIYQYWHEHAVSNPDLRLAGYSEPGYYFWDETDAYCHGPYTTREKAVAAMAKYARNL
jgi:hypothetical protein